MRHQTAGERRERLLGRLHELGYVSSSAAAAELGVSEMTIRRDLRLLAEEGAVRRVTGGASWADGNVGRSFELRREDGALEKEAVAKATAGLLGDAKVVAMDAGTTVAALARRLPAGVTVVTHSVPVILTCTARSDLDVIALGGAYHAGTRSFTGPMTRAGLGELAVDVAVLSAAAVGPTGAYSSDSLDADTKRAMAGIAQKVILTIGHQKLEARAPIRVFGLEGVDTVVVDEGASAAQLEFLRANCGDVVVAPRR